jgi:tetratricopeptide (TPR) repeat protein
MSDDSVTPGRSVLISGEEIAWIGPASEERRVAAARRVEGEGRFLAPGLIDMHAHVQDRRDLVAFLRHGVTTLASMSGDPSLLELREGVYKALYVERAVDQAVRIFELNRRAFPESSNVWDSLGEALAEQGDAAAAIASYERSLALAPGNDNATRMIARLRSR